MNNYDKAKIDPECLPLVEYFNRHGLTTAMSCQGHNNTNMSMYWIEFASGVGEKDIIRFQQEHMPGILGNFTSNGRFAMRLYMAWMITDAYVLLKGGIILQPQWMQLLKIWNNGNPMITGERNKNDDKV